MRAHHEALLASHTHATIHPHDTSACSVACTSKVSIPWGMHTCHNHDAGHAGDAQLQPPQSHGQSSMHDLNYGDFNITGAVHTASPPEVKWEGVGPTVAPHHHCSLTYLGDAVAASGKISQNSCKILQDPVGSCRHRATPVVVGGVLWGCHLQDSTTRGICFSLPPGWVGPATSHASIM